MENLYREIWLVWEVSLDGRTYLHMVSETEGRAKTAEVNLRAYGRTRLFIEKTVTNHLYGASVELAASRALRKEP